MEKKLSEMSLEELWQLFPIYLVEHKDYWKEWYNEEVFLKNTLLKNEIEIMERIRTQPRWIYRG